MLRVFREYQNTTLLMEKGHKSGKTVEPGGLANFCYTCPRIGVNVDPAQLDDKNS